MRTAVLRPRDTPRGLVAQQAGLAISAPYAGNRAGAAVKRNLPDSAAPQ
jgi:hypothetical protein